MNSIATTTTNRDSKRIDHPTESIYIREIERERKTRDETREKLKHCNLILYTLSLGLKSLLRLTSTHTLISLSLYSLLLFKFIPAKL